MFLNLPFCPSIRKALEQGQWQCYGEIHAAMFSILTCQVPDTYSSFFKQQVGDNSLPLSCKTERRSCSWQVKSYEAVTEWKSWSLSVKEAESGSQQCTGRGWSDSIVFDREEDVRATIPCCIKEPTPNQKLLRRVKLFSTTSDPGLQGWASYHSYGLNLGTRQEIEKLFLNLCRLWDLKKNNLLFILLEHLPQE